MTTLSIHNIGPIRSLEISLNRVNVFIGPQSCGKSTVAKILAYCQWLEKDCIFRGTTSDVSADTVRKCLIDYYNMSDYFTADSSFQYDGKALILKFHNNEVEVEAKEGFQKCGISKNAYIPSERNLISVPGIFTTKMPDNYLLDFIDDWQRIRDKYQGDDSVDLLRLGASYHYDISDNTDKVTLADGKTIPMSQASSGFQSAIPLCVCIDYLTRWVFEHEENRSASDRERLRNIAMQRIYMELINDDRGRYDDLMKQLKEIDPEKFSNTLSASLSRVGQGEYVQFSDAERNLLNLLQKLLRYTESKDKPKFANLVIEEPEQNLFPATQVDLMSYILSHVNHSRDNLVVTTHSPYILYALNNCMVGALVEDGERELALDLAPSAMRGAIDPTIVSVWELGDGGVSGDGPIQDKRGLIRGNYFDRVMKNVMADFNNLIQFTHAAD